MLKAIGFEVANSTVKGKTDTKEFLYANTRRLVSDQAENVFGDLTGPVGKPVYRLGGDTNSYTVGDIEHDAISSTSADDNRYDQDSFLSECLFALARGCMSKDVLHLVTGLPSTHYKNGEIRDNLKKLLLNEGLEHEVVENNIRKKFTVKYVEVLLQPMGSFFYLMFDHMGDLRGEQAKKLSTGRKLVVDIGFGTTDLADINGVQLEAYGGFDFAMGKILQMLDRRIKAKWTQLSGSNHTLFMLDDMIRKQNCILTYKGEEYNFYDLKEEVFALGAEQIMTRIKQEQYAFDNYKYVIFTGGGVDALGKHLEKHIEIKHAIKVGESQKANARGFHAWSKYLAKKRGGVQ